MNLKPIELLIRKHNNYPDWYFYIPMGINIFSSDWCPVGCSNCGVNAKTNVKDETRISKERILKILDQAHELRIPTYMLTYLVGSEPFIRLVELCDIIKRYQQKMDGCKLNTSALTFTSFKKAKAQLKMLKNNGWTNILYIIPNLSISLGMQQVANNIPVPFENIINGILAFKDIFSQNEATLLITHYIINNTFNEYPEILMNKYKDISGEDLDVRIKTSKITLAGRAKKTISTKAEDKIREKECFRPDVGSYINPLLNITLRGEYRMCTFFGMHTGIQKNNIYTVPIDEKIHKINNDPFFGFIVLCGGLPKLYEEALNFNQSIKNKLAENVHQVCKILYDEYEENVRFRAVVDKCVFDKIGVN